MKPLLKAVALILLAVTLAGCTPQTPGDTTAANPGYTTDGAEETTAETYPDISNGALNVVSKGRSRFTLVAAADDITAKASAYYLKKLILSATGADIPLSSTESDLCIAFTTVSDGTLGNNGYSVSVSGTKIDVRAGGLAGFDKASAELAACAAENSLAVKTDFSSGEVGMTASYTHEKGYKEANKASPFYNDLNDKTAYVCNTMWHQFGLIDDGQNLVYKFGNEPTYFEWVSEKMVWSGDASYINTLKNKIKDFPQTDTGFLWSWSTYPYWKVDTTYAIHYDGTFRYISAVYDIISWENNTRTLEMKDGTIAGSNTAMDASRGKTVYEKTVAAMDYILTKLHGNEGYIQITEDSVYLADGKSRFDKIPGTNEFCWNNTGKNDSSASNYWDNLCFGNYDAYENALFYEALSAMVGIEKMLGNTENVKKYEDLMVKVKEKYDELYWSEEKGRYIACIDTDGRKVDFGFTFVNYEALKYGLGNADKAKSVFSWIDGERIVEGDTLTGDEIMSYTRLMNTTTGYRSKKNNITEPYYLAAVTNTLSINKMGDLKAKSAWWHGPAGINVFSTASFGSHLENGGYIFYTVFYELAARTKYLGADSTVKRLEQIADVYEFNKLNSDTMVSGSTNWLEGLTGEFPESGLVPSVYIYSLLGVNAGAGELVVAPSFPTEYSVMGVDEIKYANKKYSLEVSRDGGLTVTCLSSIDMKLVYTPNRFDKFTVKVTGKNGSVLYTGVCETENGVLTLPLTYDDVDTVKITPVLD